MAKLKFPEGFLWGAATAAHQVEGDQSNDWTEYEKSDAVRLATSARDFFKDKLTAEMWQKVERKATDPRNYISGKSVDHFNRYKEDIQILKQLNLNSFRFSIEWSRIEPRPGKFDPKALAHYQAVIKELQKNKIEPLITLHHFSNPLWLSKIGDWSNPKFPDYFVRYTEYLAKNLNVKWWATINEPSVYLFMRYLDGVIWGGWPNQAKSPLKFYKARANFVKAHRKAYLVIKEHHPNSMIGIVHGITWFEAVNKLSKLPVKLVERQGSWWYLDRLHQNLDFIGVDYYLRVKVRVGLSLPYRWYQSDMNAPNVSDVGWESYPKGIYFITQALRKRYQKPILITENGIADADDSRRADFIKSHLKWLAQSIKDGADIRGYFHWSLLDNFEWSAGWWPKFGLVEVDSKTMKRTIRPSARVYSQIAKSNQLEIG